MSLFDDSSHSPFFINRAEELVWLQDRFRKGRHGTTLQIVGSPGVGKTALIHRYILIDFGAEKVLWKNAGPEELDLDLLSYELRNNKDLRAVVVDDADSISKQIDEVHARVFNRKSIRTLVLTSRRTLSTRRADTQTLRLEPLDINQTVALFQQLSGSSVPTDLASFSQGHPLTIHLLAQLLKAHEPAALLKMLEGSLYDIQNQIHVPRRELIKVVKPRVRAGQRANLRTSKKAPAGYSPSRSSQIRRAACCPFPRHGLRRSLDTIHKRRGPRSPRIY